MTVRGYYNALQQLRRPGARLVRQHCADRPSQCGFFILPGGLPVSENTARALIAGRELTPVDEGLFPDHPQSWRVGPDVGSRS